MPRPLVFVLMSQRSGTSALVHTLNEHPGAAVGIERYKHLWKDWPEAYDPTLFERDRFFALDRSETNILGTKRWTTYYERKHDLWGPDTLSGDKVQPISEEMVRGILEQTPQARFLYPFRHLLPLASSYAVRARDPEDRNWSENRGALAGLRVWRRDNRTVLSLLEAPDIGPSILPIAYEDFFPGDPVTIQAVLDHVGLPDDPAFRAQVQKNADRHAEVQQKELALTYEEVEQLTPHVHDPAHVELRRRAPSTHQADEPASLEAELARLRQQAAHAQDLLDRTRSRRSVRVALAAANTAGKVRRKARERWDARRG